MFMLQPLLEQNSVLQFTQGSIFPDASLVLL